MDGDIRQLKAQRGRWGLWVGLTVVMAGAVFAALQLRQPPKSVPPKPKAESIVLESRLPSGRSCHVTLRAVLSAAGRAERLETVEVLLDGQSVRVPAEAYADLREVIARNPLAVAEFAGETYWTLSGGQGTNTWQAKFTFRNGYLAERQFLVGGPSDIVRYARPAGSPTPPRSTVTNLLSTGKFIEPQPVAKEYSP